MKSDPTHTRLESILDRELSSRPQDSVEILGTSSLVSVAYFLSQSYSKNINLLPHLVIVPSKAILLRLAQAFSFFDPSRTLSTASEFDVSPYSGLYPSPKIVQERLEFIFRAHRAHSRDIFLATPMALTQPTIPFKEFSEFLLQIRAGDELPAEFLQKLQTMGYLSVPVVEDKGQFAWRGGIVDIFSPASENPIRIELFGDQIESLRFFSVNDQRSLSETKEYFVIPAREVLFLDSNYDGLIESLRKDVSERPVNPSDREEMLRALSQKNYFQGIDFLSPFFYSTKASLLDHFSSPLNVWLLDHDEVLRSLDFHNQDLKKAYESSAASLLRPDIGALHKDFQQICFPQESRFFYFSNLESIEKENQKKICVGYKTHSTQEFSNLSTSLKIGSDAWIKVISEKMLGWKSSGYRIFISGRGQSFLQRLIPFFERMNLNAKLCALDEFLWDQWLTEQDSNLNLIHLIPRTLCESQRLDEERVLFLKEEDFFGKKDRTPSSNAGYQDFQKQARRLSFGDLKPGDLVVHIKHGIGRYDGLKALLVNGVDAEFIQLVYKDNDRLYLPVYHVSQLQKYSESNPAIALDKLGGTQWEKTKIKVKNQLRDIASDLLKLYATRAELKRPPFQLQSEDLLQFESSFPYAETEDQLRAIEDISKDLTGERPMDRLICGDVGFGKTEVAMRAAYFAVKNKKQVALLAPTTVLTFQHVETFKKRFAGFGVEIRVLNRFVSTAEAKKTLADLAEGKVDILIGTHRLLSKDVNFKNLGLLIIDEEQRFGVAHKERIRKIKVAVDTLALSATPIPRTLNMSLVGIRDLSLINTAPMDRLPTRTFICKFEEETLRKAIESEISRGGQVYFIHNRIQSIYSLADEIRKIVPKARIKIAHGQMEEEDLEKTMLSFFHHEIDVLICTAIVESGMDVPSANTMFIDQAQIFGLSQLYQLRGRVGRSKERAYCYLILPKDRRLDKEAQERLKIIQENTALGSGIKIAQYDLELRGSGNILGEDQSGHISSVGYELYMDLLTEALADIKGQPLDDLELEPEISLRIPALIPDQYISDIRLRLSYYKALADIKSDEDARQIEEELRDQFGPIPEPTINLIGLMMIRRQCKELGVRDISAGTKTISLIFTERTKFKPETAIQLALRENKKYAITPDNKLNIRMNNITWFGVYEELRYLLSLV